MIYKQTEGTPLPFALVPPNRGAEGARSSAGAIRSEKVERFKG